MPAAVTSLTASPHRPWDTSIPSGTQEQLPQSQRVEQGPEPGPLPLGWAPPRRRATLPSALPPQPLGRGPAVLAVEPGASCSSGSLSVKWGQ